MMLSHQTIKRLVERGEDLTIFPFNEENVGPASYDLTLGNSFTIIERSGKVRTMTEPFPCRLTVTEADFVIPPKGFVLATTQEYIKVSDSYALYVEGRSSIGRMGLQVQNAGFVDPGFEGQITLELFNASDVPIALTPGRRICQVTFLLLDEPTDKPYRGKYMKQMGATDSRIDLDREVQEDAP